MAFATNSPVEQTVLRLQARKSLALGLWLVNRNDVPYDVAGCEFRLVIRKAQIPAGVADDSANLIANSVAEMTMPAAGYVKFNLQASDLNHPPGEYAFSIVLDDNGYTSTIVQGVVELEQNMEFTSVGESYTEVGHASSLRVALENQVALRVSTGDVLAPGELPFLDGDKAKLDSLAQSDWSIDNMSTPGAIKNRPLLRLVPNPLAPGEVLTSHGNQPGQFGWAFQTRNDPAIVEDPNDLGFFIEVGEGAILMEDPSDPGFFIAYYDEGGINPTGVAAGAVPTANGADGWGWRIPAIPADLDDVPDSATRQAVTPEERAALEDILTNGSVVTWDNINDKPAFGSAALRDVEAFAPASGIDGGAIGSGTVDAAYLPMVSQLQGWTHGTGAPTGPPGTIYLKHS